MRERPTPGRERRALPARRLLLCPGSSRTKSRTCTLGRDVACRPSRLSTSSRDSTWRRRAGARTPLNSLLNFIQRQAANQPQDPALTRDEPQTRVHDRLHDHIFTSASPTVRDPCRQREPEQPVVSRSSALTRRTISPQFTPLLPQAACSSIAPQDLQGKPRPHTPSDWAEPVTP
jgi:hypothetical protein